MLFLTRQYYFMRVGPGHDQCGNVENQFSVMTCLLSSAAQCTTQQLKKKAHDQQHRVLAEAAAEL